MSSAVPVLLAMPYTDFERSDPVGAHQALIDDARSRMRDDVLDAPGPLLAIPLDVLTLAAQRDVAADVRDIEATRQELGNDERTARNYVLFLRDVVDSTPVRRRERAIGLLFQVHSPDGLAALLADYPELSTADARDAVLEHAAGASDEQRAIGAALVALLRRAADDDVEGAWREFERSISQIVERYASPQIQELEERFAAFRDGGALLMVSRASHGARLNGLPTLVLCFDGSQLPVAPLGLGTLGPLSDALTADR